MKICNNCRRVQPDTVTICSNCGRTSFREALIDINDLEEEVIAKKERKRKRKLCLALLALFVIFLFIILITVIKVKQDANNNINSYSQSENITQFNVKSNEIYPSNCDAPPKS